MREIKFRAWDKVREEMFDVSALTYSRVYDEHYNNGPGKYAPRDESILMQYTGLKDINSVEIYEGDVIQRTYLFSGGYGEKHTGYVFYKKEEASYVIRKENEFIGPKDEKLRTVLSDKSSYEVIGNIYENPELLEVELIG